MKGRTLAKMGMLAGGAVALYVFEAMLPSPVPWARIGLSNIFVIVALFVFGLRYALVVNLVRVLAGNLLLGILLSPGFLLSLTGSFVAIGIMGLMRLTLVPPLSVIGVSCLGAVSNNVTQVCIFAFLLARSLLVGPMLGTFILLGVGVGVVTGFVSARIVDKLQLERQSLLG